MVCDYLCNSSKLYNKSTTNYYMMCKCMITTLATNTVIIVYNIICVQMKLYGFVVSISNLIQLFSKTCI